MSGSLGDVRGELAGVAEQISNAGQFAGLAAARIAAAVEVLAGLGEQHSEPVLPEELRRAADELDRCLGLINAGTLAVADLDARL
ncbi:hypothetical protein [Pseudonocardia sp. GCM10023141]|uniref:hypothetical protein n=1 Tax=Pseudonocardia sp. GCM10023141 TaxID=3252653 RepID=UPI003616C3B4